MSEKLDIITIGESLIELSSGKSLTYSDTLDKYYGGDTLCSAIAALRLGSKVGYITKVGNDYFKEFLLDAWQSEGLDISQVKLVEGYNGLYFIARVSPLEKEFSYYRKKTAATTLSINDVSEEYIKSGSYFYATGIAQSLSLSAKEAVKKAFELAKKNSLTTAYDPNFSEKLSNKEDALEAFYEIIEFVDILFLNLKYDVEKLFDITSPQAIIKDFWDKGVSTVVIKSSKDGGYFLGTNGDVAFLDFWTEEILDTTASGDAFNGAFLHGMASCLSPYESARLANIVAGMQAQGIGAVKSIPSKEAVYAEFKR